MKRLDQELVDRGLCESREKAKKLILAGQVFLNHQRAGKASDKVKDGVPIEVRGNEKHVSRGGLKLEHALEGFGLDVTGLRAIDLGASTGGFTDCLLQRGASQVYAVDVGHGQLAWKIRDDARVVVMEKTNARHLQPEHFKPPFELVDAVVVDCSFISLKLILPAADRLLRAGGWIVALVKPQFEAGKKEVSQGGGVITDPEIHRRVLAEIAEFVDKQPGLLWRGVLESPITGPAGNKEFLALIHKSNGTH